MFYQQHKRTSAIPERCIAAEAGYLKAVFSYAPYVAHMPGQLSYPLDRVTGYGLISLITKLDGDGSPERVRAVSPAERRNRADSQGRYMGAARHGEGSDSIASGIAPDAGFSCTMRLCWLCVRVGSAGQLPAKRH